MSYIIADMTGPAIAAVGLVLLLVSIVASLGVVMLVGYTLASIVAFFTRPPVSSLLAGSASVGAIGLLAMIGSDSSHELVVASSTTAREVRSAYDVETEAHWSSRDQQSSRSGCENDLFWDVVEQPTRDEIRHWSQPPQRGAVRPVAHQQGQAAQPAAIDAQTVPEGQLPEWTEQTDWAASRQHDKVWSTSVPSGWYGSPEDARAALTPAAHQAIARLLVEQDQAEPRFAYVDEFRFSNEVLRDAIHAVVRSHNRKSGGAQKMVIEESYSEELDAPIFQAHQSLTVDQTTLTAAQRDYALWVGESRLWYVGGGVLTVLGSLAALWLGLQVLPGRKRGEAYEAAKQGG